MSGVEQNNTLALRERGRGEGARYAFTLAEVLITLVIIGVVATMTMPTLIQKYKNRVVETRLMKFYSAINQAVKMAEVDYGDKKIWYADLTGAQLDNDGNPIVGSSEAEKWFKKYLAPYMKITKTEILSDGGLMVYFPDGSAVRVRPHTTGDWVFFAGNPDKCIKNYGIEGKRGVCAFMFGFMPVGVPGTTAWTYHVNKGFEPSKYRWDGTEEQLRTACIKNQRISDIDANNYCTALIQLNSCKIPDDYPYKVSY